MTLPRTLATLLASAAIAVAQPPAAKPADAPKPAEPVKKEEPKKEEPTDVKTFTFATDAEYNDAVQQFAVLFGKLAPKPAPGTTAKAIKFTSVPRAKAFAVRGTKADLETADAVVKVLQGTGDAKTQVIKLKNANVLEVTQALGTLELADGVVALRGANTLVLTNTDAVLTAQVKKVIEACEKIDPKTAKAPSVGD